MQIIRKSDGINVTKDEGTHVDYHIFPEYELHYNIVPPGTIQLWHHHKIIEEVLFIISGKIEAHWLKDDEKVSTELASGDIARVEDTPHTFINGSDEPVVFLVIRLILEGKNKHEIIKNDKYLDKVN